MLFVTHNNLNGTLIRLSYRYPYEWAVDMVYLNFKVSFSLITYLLGTLGLHSIRKLLKYH